MYKINKTYLSFAELKEKWGITSDELHYLIQDRTVTPSIAWNGYASPYHWERNENGGTSLKPTQNKNNVRLNDWVYLNLPTTTGNCDYEFSYCTKKLFTHSEDFALDTWFQLMDGNSEIAIACIGRKFIEEHAVFMKEGIEFSETLELDISHTLTGDISQKKLAYTTDTLNLLNLAITEFFNPRQSVDARKEEVTEWLKTKGTGLTPPISDNIADAIFTIIKPNDHNPRKRRG